MTKKLKITKKQIKTLIKENKRILNERVSSVVYHWASPNTARKIVESNRFYLMSTLFKGSESKLVGASHNHLYYMSLTRNGKICQGGYSDNDHSWVRFTLDGDRINSNYHTKAIDYWKSSMGKNSRMKGSGEHNGKPGYIPKDSWETEAEDRLYSRKPVIENALSYIKHIDIYIKFNKVVGNRIDLKDVYEIYCRCGSSIISVYTSLKDFNNATNPLDPEELYGWLRDQYAKTSNNDGLYSDYFNIGDYQFVDFLAGVSYLVNFPARNMSECIKTLKQYGLERYIKKVVNKYNSDRLLFAFGKNGWTSNIVERVFDEAIFDYLQMGEGAKDVDREDLSKGYLILTDFCNKHKLSNYDDILSYLKKLISSSDDDITDYDWDAVVDITCVYLKDEPQTCYLCLDPQKDHYSEVITNGKDYLIYIYNDVKYEIKYSDINHKSKSNDRFLGYVKRLFNSNPTVQEVSDFYDKWNELKNTGINDSYCPIVTVQKLPFDKLYSLLGHASVVHLDNGIRLKVADQNQKRMLLNLYNNRNRLSSK